MATFIPKEEAENCWEFMNCPNNLKEKCAAYITESGNECWNLVNSAKGCPIKKEEEGSCLKCEWFENKNSTL